MLTNFILRKFKNEKSTKSISFDEVIENSSISIILGEPASGKTAQLENYEENSENASLLEPIFVEEKESIEEQILLFDSIDESIIKYPTIEDKLWFYIKKNKNKKFVITCRYLEWKEKFEKRLKKLDETLQVYKIVSLSEKKILLKELNHRVKNNLQTILFFVGSQIHHTSDRQTQVILENLKHRIFAISHLHTLLHQKETIDTIEAKHFFTLIVEHMQKSFLMSQIEIYINTSALLKAKDAFYCGFILNEAMTNIYQHAFTALDKGEVFITLTYENGLYTLIVKDTGKGYDNTHQKPDSSGLYLIERLVSIQLEGTFSIEASQKGTTIQILWEEEKDV